MYHQFQLVLVIQVVVQTILVVVATATLHHLDPIVVQVGVAVQTVVNSTQVDMVVTEVADPSTSTVVEVTDTDHTIHMVTIQQDPVSSVDHNHHHITKVTIPTDTNLMLHGVLGAMVLNTLIGVLEDVKVWS